MTRTLKDYRPQHDDSCEYLHRYDHAYPFEAKCSCGLAALLTSSTPASIGAARQQVIDRLCDCEATAEFGHSPAVCQQHGIDLVDALIAVTSSTPEREPDSELPSAADVLGILAPYAVVRQSPMSTPERETVNGQGETLLQAAIMDFWALEAQRGVTQQDLDRVIAVVRQSPSAPPQCDCTICTTHREAILAFESPSAPPEKDTK